MARIRTASALSALALGLALALALAPGARADEAGDADDPYGPDGRKYGPVETGTIVSVNTEQRWFTLGNEGTSMTFDVEDATVIQVGDEPVALGELEMGDEVTVSARHGQPGDDRPVAERILVVRGEAEPEPDPEP